MVHFQMNGKKKNGDMNENASAVRFRVCVRILVVAE